MIEIELTVDQSYGPGDAERASYRAVGGRLAPLVCAVVLRLADQHAGDPEMQRLADALTALEIKR